MSWNFPTLKECAKTTKHLSDCKIDVAGPACYLQRILSIYIHSIRRRCHRVLQLQAPVPLDDTDPDSEPVVVWEASAISHQHWFGALLRPWRCYLTKPMMTIFARTACRRRS